MKKVLLSLLGLMCVTGLSHAADMFDDREYSPLLIAKGPPAHAPAHGYRRKQAAYRYQYYPDAQVYFDPGRSVYFYLDGNSWVSSVRLPRHLQVNLRSPVSLDLDLAKPFKLHSEHLRLHPPKVKIKLP